MRTAPWSRCRATRTTPTRRSGYPAGKPFAALEPMAARTNGLVDGDTHLVVPGDGFTTRFTLTVA